MLVFPLPLVELVVHHCPLHSPPTGLKKAVPHAPGLRRTRRPMPTTAERGTVCLFFEIILEVLCAKRTTVNLNK